MTPQLLVISKMDIVMKPEPEMLELPQPKLWICDQLSFSGSFLRKTEEEILNFIVQEAL